MVKPYKQTNLDSIMLKIFAFYAGLLALVGLAVLGAAQSKSVPDVAPLPALTAANQ